MDYLSIFARGGSEKLIYKNRLTQTIVSRDKFNLKKVKWSVLCNDLVINRVICIRSWLLETLRSLKSTKNVLADNVNSTFHKEHKKSWGKYFFVCKIAIIFLGNVFQFLQVEWNNFLIQSDEFLLFDFIIRLVGDNSDFCKSMVSLKEKRTKRLK